MTAFFDRNAMVVAAIGLMMLAAVPAWSERPTNQGDPNMTAIDAEADASTLEGLSAQALSIVTLGVSSPCVIGPVCF